VPKRRLRAKVREIAIPVPGAARSPEELLEAKLGSREAAGQFLAEVATSLDLSPEAPRSVLSAIALAKLGADLNAVSKSLKWDDFEKFCAMAISASGFKVSRNVRLKKPTRQIDIVAESPSLVLVIDCKHWQRGAGAASLELIASAQVERTKMLVARARPGQKPHLPVVLTVFDNQVRVTLGVPVVPIHMLKDFLTSVNRFERELAFVGA
jgi:hypothetical protein